MNRTELAKLSADERNRAIARILEARFSMSIFEEMKSNDPSGWEASGNDMGRGIYGEAIREKQRLEAVSDAGLDAELAAIPRLAGPARDISAAAGPLQELPEATGRIPS